MKKSLLFIAAASLAATSMAQLPAGAYFVRNVETGMYLNSGDWWGTHAVAREQARQFEIVDEGGNLYLKSTLGFVKDNGSYVDGGSGDVMTLEAIDGNYNVCFNGKFLTVGAFNQADVVGRAGDTDYYVVEGADAADGTKSQWQFLTKEEMIAELAAATPEAPLNASFLLKDADQAVNDDNNIRAAWNVDMPADAEFIIGQSNWSGYDGLQKTFELLMISDKNTEEADYVLSQTGEGFPAGDYTATYHVVNQAGSPLVLTFNGVEGEFFTREETDLWYNSAFEAIRDNANSVNFSVAEDGKVEIKMVKTCVPEIQNRFACKNFNISYLGKSTGVDAIGEDENAPAEYFNLQGIRVANPEKGIFIKRQGKTVSKVVVK